MPTEEKQRQLNFEDLAAICASEIEENAQEEEEEEDEDEEKIYSVAEIVNLAQQQLEKRFAQVWVEGEVSNCRYQSSGHCYFTLKDAQAQMSAVIWRSVASRLKFRLEEGQLLRCRGRLTIYEMQGRFQMVVDAAEPSGLGALQLAFTQLKNKLSAEGLFDPRHKKALPMLPRTIAVVTSPTGAALQDILRVLHTRCPVRVIVCPTLVQGDDAPPQIVEALRRADELGADLIIAGRGGGSIEDLWAFNDERVARAIFATQTPIISAVGHEIDVTIADLVADRRAPTPSAAAEMAVPEIATLLHEVTVLRGRLHKSLAQQLKTNALILERLCRRLGTPHQIVNSNRQRLDDLSGRLQDLINQRLQRERQGLSQWQIRLAAEEPRRRLMRDRAQLLQQHDRLVELIRRKLQEERSVFGQYMAKLDSLSPLAVLSRGYGLVLNNRRGVVGNIAELRQGDELFIRMAHGEISSTVKDVRLGELPASTKEK